MAMFEKEAKNPTGPGTVIGTNVKLVGALRDAEDITVHGTIEGEVASDKNVMIGETAQVKGPVKGATVSIAGTVHGPVEVTDRLELLATARLFGNITARDLIICSGALFAGKCLMPDESGTRQAISESSVPEDTEIVSAKKPAYEVE